MLDFLGPETITLSAKGRDFESLVHELVLLALRERKVPLSVEEVVRAVQRREAEASTCLGEGLAIPHARLEGLDGLAGAMAINREGWDLPSLDGLPTHLMVLILTPPELAHRHLEILGMLARLVGGHPTIKERLYGVRSPEEAVELLRLAGDPEH